jgi:catalase
MTRPAIFGQVLGKSFATVDYWGVHAFTFTNDAGEQTLAKYKLVPEAGDVGLTPDEAKAKGPDF